MKFQGLNLLASTLSITSLVNAFSDTAIFYSNNNNQLSLNTNDYIIESKSIAPLVLQYSESVCSQQDSNKQLYIYRVKQLSKGDTTDYDGFILNHVHYPSVDDLHFEISESCVVKYGSDEQDSNANVIIIDVEDDQIHTIDEFLNKGHENLIIQGNPSFKHHKKLKQFANDLNEMLDDYFHHGDEEEAELHKRDEDVDDNEQLEQEIEDDFRQAESLVNGENDEPVTIFDKPIEVAKSNQTKVNNLFTKYQFFTSGIWLGIIVSLLLLSILYVAIQWLGALEVTYSSFEKQVDYDKKNE